MTLPVPSGPPSCVQCSKLALACGIVAVWLYRGEDGWVRYPIAEFHPLSLRAESLAAEQRVVTLQLEVQELKNENKELHARVETMGTPTVSLTAPPARADTRRPVES